MFRLEISHLNPSLSNLGTPYTPADEFGQSQKDNNFYTVTSWINLLVLC